MIRDPMSTLNTAVPSIILTVSHVGICETDRPRHKITLRHQAVKCTCDEHLENVGNLTDKTTASPVVAEQMPPLANGTFGESQG